MIVVDASAVVAIVVGAPDVAVPLAERVVTERVAAAPHLVDVEVVGALRRLVLSGAVRESRAREALEEVRLLGLARYAHEGLVARVLALRHVLSAYDATYVALAEALGCALVTCDRRLAATAARFAPTEVFGG